MGSSRTDEGSGAHRKKTAIEERTNREEKKKKKVNIGRRLSKYRDAARKKGE